MIKAVLIVFTALNDVFLYTLPLFVFLDQDDDEWLDVLNGTESNTFFVNWISVRPLLSQQRSFVLDINFQK